VRLSAGFFRVGGPVTTTWPPVKRNFNIRFRVYHGLNPTGHRNIDRNRWRLHIEIYTGYFPSEEVCKTFIQRFESAPRLHRINKAFRFQRAFIPLVDMSLNTSC
jgi:hypothetical protein